MESFLKLLAVVTATAANLAPVLLIAAGFGRLPLMARWLRATLGSQRAQRLMNRYGIPGLALQAPVVTGAHTATVVALLLGGSPRPLAHPLNASQKGIFHPGYYSPDANSS